MKIVAALALAGFLAGCGPKDPNKVVLNEESEVAPKQFAYKKFTLDLGGTYTLTLTPKGGNLEAWVQDGEVRPIVIYSDNEPMPRAKLFADGKEDTLTGALGWGGAHVIVFNRGSAPVRMKCKLTVVPNGPK